MKSPSISTVQSTNKLLQFYTMEALLSDVLEGWAINRTIERLLLMQKISSEMVVSLALLLVYCIAPTSTTPIRIYSNAMFTTPLTASRLRDLFPVPFRDVCACQCYIDSQCITGIFNSVNQSCSLFVVPIWQGQLQLSNSFTSVFSFTNKSVPEGELI